MCPSLAINKPCGLDKSLTSQWNEQVDGLDDGQCWSWLLKATLFQGPEARATSANYSAPRAREVPRFLK